MVLAHDYWIVLAAGALGFSLAVTLVCTLALPPVPAHAGYLSSLQASGYAELLHSTSVGAIHMTHAKPLFLYFS